MTTILCPMLTALKPIDDAGQPVDRECIYEQCRFFHLEKRDCSLMMASRAMLQMAEEGAHAAPPGGAPPADFERRLADMGKDLLHSALEVQGVVREAGQANLERTASVEARIDGRLEAIAARAAEQMAVLSELQQKVADRLLEEMSLVGAGSHKLEQMVATLEKKVDQTSQENIHLSQLVTLIKGETERTYAALRSIHEGNRAVMQAVEAQLQRDQADLKRRRHEEAQSCNNRGVLAYYRGALEAALEAFRQAVTLEPEFAEAHNNLGLVHSRLGQDKEAVNAFQQALKADPKMGEVYNNLGFLYHTSSQFERAVQMFGQAIQTAGDSSVAYTNLGNTFYKMKQPEKAVEAWQRALELDPMNENARRGLRMFQQEPNQN